MMDVKKTLEDLDDSIESGDSEAATSIIRAMGAEIERLQKLAKRGHGQEFLGSNGRFDVV